MAPSNSHFFSMGLSTYKVPKELFATNRRKLCSEFLKTVTPQLEKEEKNQEEKQTEYLCYLEGGHAETRNDSDHEPIFRQESYFHYLFGVKEPDWTGCIHLGTGKTTLFIPRLPPEYATVMGKIKQPEDFRKEYEVDEVKFTDDVEEFLSQFCASCEATGKHCKILLLKGTNSDSGKEFIPPTFTAKDIMDCTDTNDLFPVLAECRVIKSQHELDLMRYCTEITSLAHVFTMKNTKVGMMEYQSESLFKHYTYYNFGARHVGYTAICGCGPNGAVLHYGHAGAPNDRLIEDGDMCLMDMGAEYFCYGSDVTCSYPSNGKFTYEQRQVYEGVLNAQRRVIAMLKPGVSWLDCHKAAEAEIIIALEHLGIVVKGDVSVEELVEKRLGAVFMPHGLGHFIGIDTHDVGGYLPGHQPRIVMNGLRSLRTCRVVQANMTLTVEPGLYFIDHLIDEAIAENSPLRQFLNGDELNKYRGFGGVRLEDVVQITEDGCENFTICPRTIEEVEMVMSGGKWPPLKDSALELNRSRLTNPKTLGTNIPF